MSNKNAKNKSDNKTQDSQLYVNKADNKADNKTDNKNMNNSADSKNSKSCK